MGNSNTNGRPARDAYEVLEVRPDSSEVVMKAAFRALAAIHHPDAAGGSTDRMAELNDAYAQVRTPDSRAAYDRLRSRQAAIAVETPDASRFSVTQPEPGRAHGEKPAPGVIDFGRYRGWSIADLARRDPDYLRWLRRHSSGIRFRNEIEAQLSRAEAVSPAAPEGRRRR